MDVQELNDKIVDLEDRLAVINSDRDKTSAELAMRREELAIHVCPFKVGDRVKHLFLGDLFEVTLVSRESVVIKRHEYYMEGRKFMQDGKLSDHVQELGFGWGEPATDWYEVVRQEHINKVLESQT